MLPNTHVSFYQHVCFVHLVRLFSVIQHSYYSGALKWILFTTTSCFVLYYTYRYLLYGCSCYSFLLVYVGKHLYDKYLNNEPYENNSNQLRCSSKSQFNTIVYLRVPYVMKFLLCTPTGEMHIIE